MEHEGDIQTADGNSDAVGGSGRGPESMLSDLQNVISDHCVRSQVQPVLQLDLSQCGFLRGYNHLKSSISRLPLQDQIVIEDDCSDKERGKH